MTWRLVYLVRSVLCADITALDGRLWVPGPLLFRRRLVASQEKFSLERGYMTNLI